MCAAAASFARIKKIVIGATDEKGGAVVNGVRFFESKTCHFSPEIVCGVMADVSSKMLKDFFLQKR